MKNDTTMQGGLKENRVIDIPKPADANRDPITGSPGAHPVGSGVGAAGGGAAGAAIGAAVGGPVGAGVGVVVGGVLGGLAGKGAAESVNPTVEDAYWRENYAAQPWVERNYTYDDYQPAFRCGYEGYCRYSTSEAQYEDIEPEVRQDWERSRGKSRLDWDQAKLASRAAWEHARQSAENPK